MLTLHALSGYRLPCVLAVLLYFSMPAAQTAPSSELTAVAEGLAATLEISKLSSESANSISTDFSAANVENAQPYATTEVDTEAELAPTSLPLTSEEIALAEVAAVVAELTTATAADIKAQEQASDEERQWQVRRRADEAKRQAIEREIASAVEMLEDEKDSGAVSTLTTSFADVIGTTTTAQPTTAAPTTTVGPAILNELVRAAAASNEILAAALNAATMAGTNITIATTADVASADTTTTPKPDRATNTELAIGDDLLAVSDSETLPEGEVAWQPSEIETTSIATTTKKAIMNIETADAATTTPITTIASETTHSEPTPNANISNEINGDNLLDKSLESEGWREAVTNSPQQLVVTVRPKVSAEPTITTLVTEGTTETLEAQSNTETVSSLDSAALLEHFNKSPDSEETKHSMESVDHEGAESKKVIRTKEAEESTETTPPTAENEVEGETKDLPMAVLAATNARQVAETAADAAINDEATQQATSNKNERKHSSTSEPIPVENSIRAEEFEIAKVEEVKRANLRGESNQPNAVENEITTTPNSQAYLTPDTTDPLETLIAVESEARAPNKYLNAIREEVGDETVATTNAVPEAITTAEYNSAEVAADTATTTPESTLVEEKFAAESTMSPAVAVTTITPVEDTITKAPIEQNVANESQKETENDPKAIISTSTITNTDEETTAAISNGDSLVTTTTSKTTTEAAVAEKELTKDQRIDIQEGLAKTTEMITKDEETSQTWARATESTSDPEAIVSVTEPTVTYLEERVQGDIVPATESVRSSTDVPLAAFTTMPHSTEELLHAEATTEKGDLGTISSGGSREKVRESTTLNSNTAENAPAEPTDLPETSAVESESILSETTAATKATELPESTTAAGEEISAVAEAGLPATTTTKIETETETLAATEQLEAELGTTTEAALAEQPLYRRTLDAQRHGGSEYASATELTNVVSVAVAETTEATTTVGTTEVGTTIAAITTTTTTAGADAAGSTFAVATTNASVADTTTTTKISEPETTTTTTTTTKTPALETTTTTTAEPETTTTTTTTAPAPETTTTKTTTTPAPETTTTTTTRTTTSAPETTTTITTTLSPMSLIIAEHEARSLERTPPRVSRIVSDDGVEVLSGYSIVHHMHAAAMAALAAAAA
ncbi:mucin-17-like [Rhagoletis pomonella]|uniref:mucin-17-like n=1 Tax=Rhagoletis pomonella TaxID=28610 RepID=UPI001781C9EA|nr:mucin-17-like [Rhagoletis pomonella]